MGHTHETIVEDSTPVNRLAVDLHFLQHRWIPDGVPSSEEYEMMRDGSEEEFKLFLKERKAELKASLNHANPKKWGYVVATGVLAVISYILKETVDARWTAPVALLFIWIAYQALLRCVFSRMYGSAYRGQRRFFKHCRKAAQMYDYDTFHRFVATKLLTLTYH